MTEKKKKTKTAVSLLSCFCLAAVLCAGAWHSGIFKNAETAAKAENTVVAAPGLPASPSVPDVSQSGTGRTDIVNKAVSDIPVSDAEIPGGTASPAVSEKNAVSPETTIPETAMPETVQPPAENTAPPDSGSEGGKAQGSANSAFLPCLKEGDTPSVSADYTRIIAGYGDSGAGSETCYAIPENGSVGYSVPLRGAMNEYADIEPLRFRVVVDLFGGGVPLSADSPEANSEMERLASLGYIVAYEVYTDSSGSTALFTVHASYDDLASFAANPDYGYMLFLYNERVPRSSDLSDTLNTVYFGPYSWGDLSLPSPIEEEWGKEDNY